MFSKKSLIFGLVLGAVLYGIAATCIAKVSSEEAERLNKDLTSVGAERAGNADGTIPAWEGGITKPPAGWERGGPWINPFAGDKVEFTINAGNMNQYADKLSAGTKAMLKRYPDTYYLQVYPTRRSFAYPQWIYDNTFKNATEVTLSEDGFSIVVNDGWAGIPFPIPRNGNEVMHNHLQRYMGTERHTIQKQHLVTNGVPADGGTSVLIFNYPWYDPDASREEFQGMQCYIWAEFSTPARRKGEYTLVHDPFDLSTKTRQAWRYVPGARRVRLAPYIAYDGINPAFGGMVFQDEGGGLFWGAIDRYDWKIIGKQEMYIPYNCYDSINASDDQLWAGDHGNPRLTRWELHRVWIIEATVREGMRHQYARRVFYIDEDSWGAALHDAYDAQGSLWRTSQAETFQDYSVPTYIYSLQWYYDLQTRTWGTNHGNDTDFRNLERRTISYDYYNVENLRKVGRR